MAKPLLSDDLWCYIAPLLPPAHPRPKGGRPPVLDRAALTGILFVLRTGLPWEYLPTEMGCGSGMSCWRRLRDWHKAGVWAGLHRALLEHMEQTGQLDWSRASLDAIPPVRSGKRGRARSRPDKLHADKAYDSRRCRAECRARGIKSRIARKGMDSSQRLGRHRWIGERIHA